MATLLGALELSGGMLGPNLLKSLGQIFKTRSRMATLLGALELLGGMLGPIV